MEVWYRDLVLYEVPVRAFYDSNGDGIGDLNGLTEKLDYICDLGVGAIWLLPIYPSPLRDDGYDVADFRSIHPDLGTLDDFRRLLDRAHAAGLRVLVDLVLNHTSDQHPWFQSARLGPGSPYHDYYVWSPTPDRYAGTRVIFVDTEPSNWTLEPSLRALLLAPLLLPSARPQLRQSAGAPGDARRRRASGSTSASTASGSMRCRSCYEREGTSCENLPETHAYLRELRASSTPTIRRACCSPRRISSPRSWSLLRDRRRVPPGVPLPAHAAHVPRHPHGGLAAAHGGHARRRRRSRRTASGPCFSATTTS